MLSETDDKSDSEELSDGVSRLTAIRTIHGYSTTQVSEE